MKFLVSAVTSLLGEKCKVSDKTIQMDKRITVRPKVSYEERLVLVALENAEDQRLNEFQDQWSESGSKPKEESGTYSKRDKIRSNKTSTISEISTARRILYWITKALKENEELQTQLSREARQNEIAYFQEELARKARIAGKEKELSKTSSSQGTSFRSISSVDSVAKLSGRMDKTETPENGTKSIIALAVHSTPESTVKLVHERKLSAPMLESKPLDNLTIPTELIGKT